jgi:hypothetical protein
MKKIPFVFLYLFVLSSCVSNGQWMLFPNPAATATKSVSPTPQSPPRTVTPVAAPTASPLFYNYTNTLGGYAFNYPSNWRGKEIETRAYFYLPDQSKMEVNVRAAQANETLRSLTQADEGPLPPPPAKTREIILASEMAVCQDVLNAAGDVTARMCYAIHNKRVYFIAVFSPPESPLAATFAVTLTQFELVLSSFQFLP